MLYTRRNFYWMITGRSVSKLGDTFTFLALMLMIFDRTGSALSVGQVLLTTFLPGVLLGPVIGVWIDRLDKRRLTVVCELLRALVVLAIPFVPTLGFLYVLTFLSAMLGNASRTAQNTLVRDVFPREELMGYNARIRSAVEVMGVLGPILAGTVIAFWSYQTAFLVDSVTFLYSAIALLMLRLPPREQSSESSQSKPSAPKPSFWGELVAGARYMRSQPRIVNTVAIMFTTMLVGGMFNVLFVVFSKDVIRVTDQQFGWLEAALGLGYALGAALMGKWRHIDPLTYVRGSTVLVGLIFASLGFVTNFYAELLVVIALGLCSVVAVVAGPTLLQTESDKAYLGRVMGFFQTLFNAGTVLSMALAGVVAEAFGVRDVLLYGGGIQPT